METYAFKKDKFSKYRGSHSRLLNIFCRKCKSLIAIYQKDGPGNLRRMYFDRIFYPKSISGLENKKISSVRSLNCKCGSMLGTPYVHEKENRKAFKMYQDAAIKKVRKLKD